MTEMYEKIKNKVIEIVKQASKIMKKADFSVKQKDGAINVVTSADLETQQYLCEKLKKLLPGSGFYCEEEGLKDTRQEYIWVIDPIDGTTNYTRGISECAISVGLLHKKEAVVGVVYVPFKDEMFSAVKGGGAWLNGKPIRVSEKTFGESLFCTAMSLYKKSLAPVCMQIIMEAYESCNDFRRFGACSVELCYLAAGKCDLFFEIRVFPWDYAGAFVVLKEAGGVIKGFDQKELSFDETTPVIAANNAENYERLNGIVKKYMKEVPYKE